MKQWINRSLAALLALSLLAGCSQTAPGRRKLCTPAGDVSFRSRADDTRTAPAGTGASH